MVHHSIGHVPKEKLCPKHYLIQHPPEEQEKIYCDICGRTLEYICVTCQSYSDDFEKSIEAFKRLNSQIEQSVKPIEALVDPAKKTIDAWHKEKFLNVDDLEKLRKISGLDTTKEHSWEDIWFILVNGWEVFAEYKAKQDEQLEEMRKKAVEAYEKNKREREIRERAEAESKRQAEETDEILQGLKDNAREQQKVIVLYINSWIEQEEEKKARRITQEQTILIRECVNLLRKAKERLEIQIDSKFYFSEIKDLEDKMRVANIRQYYNAEWNGTDGLKEQEKKLVKFEEEIEALKEKMRNETEGTSEVKTVKEWYESNQTNISTTEWEEFKEVLFPKNTDNNGNYSLIEEIEEKISFKEIKLTLKGLKRLLAELRTPPTTLFA